LTRHFFEESLGSLARLQEAKLEYLLAIINLFSHFHFIKISYKQCAVDDFTAFDWRKFARAWPLQSTLLRQVVEKLNDKISVSTMKF